MSDREITLRNPAIVGGVEIARVLLRSPTARELFKLRLMNASSIVVGTKMMCLVTGLDRAALDAIEEVNAGFKQKLSAYAAERVKAVHNG